MSIDEVEMELRKSRRFQLQKQMCYWFKNAFYVEFNIPGIKFYVPTYDMYDVHFAYYTNKVYLLTVQDVPTYQLHQCTRLEF